MRGPGAAPLRMETDDQRKFGYGGDGLPPDHGGDDGNWSQVGLAAHLAPTACSYSSALVLGLCGNIEDLVAVSTHRPKETLRKSDMTRNSRPGRKGSSISRVVAPGR